MSNRYHLVSDWRDDADMRRLGVPYAPPPAPAASGRIDGVRSTWNTILRNDDLDALQVEDRRWGFHRNYPDADNPQQPSKRELFVADGAQVTKLPSFKLGFALRRCLIPMSSWSDWRHINHKKTLIEVSLPGRPVFAVAGLYETSQDIRTGVPVDTFIILTATPSTFFGSAQHAVPLVLDAEDFGPWLNDRDAAHRLVQGVSNVDDCHEEAVKTGPAELFSVPPKTAFRV